MLVRPIMHHSSLAINISFNRTVFYWYNSLSRMEHYHEMVERVLTTIPICTFFTLPP